MKLGAIITFIIIGIIIAIFITKTIIEIIDICKEKRANKNGKKR